MEKNKINLLLVDDEEEFLKSMSTRLEVRDFNVIASKYLGYKTT